MPAYDNPVRNFRTRKILENEVGPNQPSCTWVLVKGKCIGQTGENQEIEFNTWTKLEILNPNLLKAGVGGLELVIGYA